MSAPNAFRVVMALLKADATLVALVPVGRMHQGFIPQGSALPALSLRNISDNDRQTISGNEATVMETGRIEVTVAAKDYPTKERLIGAVRKACENKRGVINGITVNNVRNAGLGPDLDNEEASIFGRSIDLMITSKRDR